MTDALDPVEVEDHEQEDHELRVARRYLNLLEDGFTPDQIERLHPERAEFDWHEADALVKAGCSTEMAVEILA